MTNRAGRFTVVLFCCVLSMAGCAQVQNFEDPAVTPQIGPIIDVKTPFDEALECLRPHINNQVTFAVGNVSDHTGRESYNDGGTGKFVSQGASAMVQSALFRSGATLVNRRDVAIPVEESRWGVRNLATQRPAMQYISGSINGLDFIPGGGASVLFNGVGPRYRQSRVLISLDLYMTDAATGIIVANVPLQKQLFSKEIGFSAGRFVGSTLVGLDAGGQDREALNFALRQMLSLATFELLAQRMSPKNYLPCRSKIDALQGVVEDAGTGKTVKVVYAELERLKTEDPEAAEILERELAGEKIEDIMRDLGKPLPEKVIADKPAPSAKKATVAAKPELTVTPVTDAKPAAAPAAETLSANRAQQEAQTAQNAPESEPAAPMPPLIVSFTDEGDQTTLAVTLQAPMPVRWGFKDGKLVLVALSNLPFRLAPGMKGPSWPRVKKLATTTRGDLQILTLDLDCDCGAVAQKADDDRLLLSISEGAAQPELKVTQNLSGPQIRRTARAEFGPGPKMLRVSGETQTGARSVAALAVTTDTLPDNKPHGGGRL